MRTARVPAWLFVVVVSALGGALISDGLPRAVSDEQPLPKASDVAVLDVAKVFEKSQGFQTDLGRIKKDVEGFELVLKQAKQEYDALKQQFDALPKGSEESRKLELDLATRQANLQVEMKTKREGFLLEEAASYAKWYASLQKVVQEIAARKQVRLVFRNNSEGINEKDRQSVLQGVNRWIVFQDRLDITEEVIKALNDI
jgi:Skp family chaperone for outer membrane proteins